MQPAIFLDRDRCINKRRPDSPDPRDWYVMSWDQWEWADGAIEGLKLLAETKYRLIVVSNQACVGKGLAEYSEIEAVFDQMESEICQYTQISIYRLDYIFCPHAPEEGCECRKPKPGMIWKAAVEHGITLNESWIVGDSTSDIMAGVAAGINKRILIREQRNASDAHTVVGNNFHAHVRPNLLEAAKLIIVEENRDE